MDHGVLPFGNVGRNPLDDLVAGQRNVTHDMDHMGKRTMARDGGAMGKGTSEVPFMWTDAWQGGAQLTDLIDSMSTMGTSFQEGVDRQLGGLRYSEKLGLGLSNGSFPAASSQLGPALSVTPGGHAAIHPSTLWMQPRNSSVLMLPPP